MRSVYVQVEIAERKESKISIRPRELAKTWNHTSGYGWNRRKGGLQDEKKVCFKIT